MVGMTAAVRQSTYTQCSSKAGFDSQDEAHVAMMNGVMRFACAADRARLRTYLCPHCMLFHYGKRPVTA
jgi:hypothetical protein